MFDKNKLLGGSIDLDKKNSNVTQTLYLHVHRFEAFPSIICLDISRGQVIKALRQKM